MPLCNPVLYSSLPVGMVPDSGRIDLRSRDGLLVLDGASPSHGVLRGGEIGVMLRPRQAHAGGFKLGWTTHCRRYHRYLQAYLFDILELNQNSSKIRKKTRLPASFG